MIRSILTVSLGVAFASAVFAESPPLAEGDLAFVEKVASKGLMEVAVSQHAADHGVSPDVKLIGRTMVEDHTKANNALLDLAGKKGITVSQQMKADHQSLHDRLLGLEGDEFDRTYIDEMVKGHRESVDLFGKFKNEGQDADLKAFADQTLPVIEHHLLMVENLQAGRPIHQAKEATEPLKTEPGL